MVWLSRHAHDGWPRSLTNQARLGLRAERSFFKQISFWGHQANGICLAQGWLRSGSVDSTQWGRDRMNRRKFLGGAAALAAATPAARISAAVSSAHSVDICGCEPMIAQSPSAGEQAARADAFRDLSSGLKVTNLKVFGVSLTPDSDRPYVFVKLETNQGVVGWGEGTLEGKAGAAMACIDDFRDSSSARTHAGGASLAIDVCPQLLSCRPGDWLGHFRHRPGAVGHSRQGLGLPVYQLLGGPNDPRGVRGYYHAANARSRGASWQNCVRQRCAKASPASRVGLPE